MDDELTDISDAKDAADDEGTVSFIDLFRKSQLRKPLIISIMIMIAQQFSGINAVSNFQTFFTSVSSIFGPS